MDLDAPITVFLVDDHAVVREGIRAVLQSTGRMRVVGEAATVAEALPRIIATRPRVAVLDMQLPDGTGTQLCTALRASAPLTACLVLTAFPDDDVLFESIVAGAAGFLLKHVRAEGLIDAVDRVAAGESLIDPAVTGRLLHRIRHPQETADPRLATLSPTERLVLKCLVEGRTNREIAPLVHVSENTVKNYVSAILRKLGLARRTEAAVFAMRSGEFES